MFSALKRLVSNQNDQGNRPVVNDGYKAPHGVSVMDHNLQKKFAKGVQYNMKIVIKGDRNVGKTCLFLRLKGEKFKEEYDPTDEIQVASIQWNYRATDDVVKVEVWDVVDKGKKKKKIEGLKLDNNAAVTVEEDEQPVLDAELVDVYKGTNGVIMVFDMTKQWTFDYIQREITNVPVQIPILILSNHRDMGHHRVISEDQVKTFIEGLGRSGSPGQIRYAEASMRNGFGLKFIHKFFNLPFLHLQRETLLKQLETNCNEIQTTCQELDLVQESDEQNYDLFLNYLTNKRRQIADELSQVPSTLNSNGTAHQGPPKSLSVPANLSQKQTNSISNNDLIKATPSIIIGATKPLPKKFNANINNTSIPISNATKNNSNHNSPIKNNIKSVEDFIPDDDQYKSFLEDAIETTATYNNEINQDSESDSETLNRNPLVSDYQEDLDPEDNLVGFDNKTVNLPEKNDQVKEIEVNQVKEIEVNQVKTEDKTQDDSVEKLSEEILTCEITHDDIFKQVDSSKKESSIDNSIKIENSDAASEASSRKSNHKSNKSKEDKKKSKNLKKKKKVKTLDNSDDEDAKKFEEFLSSDNSISGKQDYELF